MNARARKPVNQGEYSDRFIRHRAGKRKARAGPGINLDDNSSRRHVSSPFAVSASKKKKPGERLPPRNQPAIR